SRQKTAIAMAPTVTRLELNFMSPSLLAAHGGPIPLAPADNYGLTEAGYLSPEPRISYHVEIFSEKKVAAPQMRHCQKNRCAKIGYSLSSRDPCRDRREQVPRR